MNISCPICSQNTNIDQVKEIEEMEIRREMIPVERIFYRCENCGEEFEVLDDNYDPYASAYREYRRRKDWLQPEEIKEFREKLGLTQQQFSELLGIGIATLNRYENGALQSESNEQLIECFLDDQTLIIKKINKYPDLFSPNEMKEIIKKVQSQHSEKPLILKIALDNFAEYSESEFSGFQKFNLNKFINVIKFFCSDDGVLKTKLLKLLFYADFKYFKDYKVSITGARYARINYGPVPDNYQIWLSLLSSWLGEVSSEEILIGEHYGEIFTACGEPDLNAFLTSEIQILGYIKEYFKNFTASRITDFSHNETSYKNTTNGNLISYKYAKDLQI